MKKFIGIVLAVAIMATMFAAFSFTTTVGAVSANLLSSDASTFEGSSTGGWTAFAGGAVALSTTVKHGGNQALVQTGRTAAYVSPGYNIYDILKANGAGSYELSFWVYADGLAAAASGAIMVRCTTAGTYSFIPSGTNNNLASKLVANQTWVKLSAFITVTAADITGALGTGSVTLCTDTMNSPTLYIDDASVIYYGDGTAPLGQKGYNFSFLSTYTDTSCWSRIESLGSDVLNTTTHVATVVLKNTSSAPIDTYLDSRDSTWGSTVDGSANKVTIPAGAIRTITLSNVPATNTILLLQVSNITTSTTYTMGNITKVTSAATINTNSSNGTSVVVALADLTAGDNYTPGANPTVAPIPTAAPGATATPVPTATPLPVVTGFQYKVDGVNDTSTAGVNLYLNGVTGQYDAATDSVTLYVMNTSTKSLNFQMFIGWSWDGTGDNAANKTSAIGDKVDIAAGQAVKLTVTGLKNYFTKTGAGTYNTHPLDGTDVIRLIITGAAANDTFVMAGITAIGSIKGNGASTDMIANLTQITAPTALANLVNGVTDTTTTPKGTGDPSMVAYAFAAISGLGALVAGKRRFKK